MKQFLPFPTSANDVVAAGIILRRRLPQGGDVWLLLKNRKLGEWGFPKGHQEAGETLIATALRECAEETGIAVFAIEGPPIELHYRLPNSRSKKVVYYPAVTAMTDVILSPEHTAHRWAPTAVVPGLLGYANLRSLFQASLHALRRRP